MSRPQVYINRELPAARRLVTTASPRHRVTNAFQQTNIGLYAALTDSPGRAGYRGSTPPVPPKRCSEPLSGVPAVHPPDSPRRAESALTAPLSVLFRRYAKKPHVPHARCPESLSEAFPRQIGDAPICTHATTCVHALTCNFAHVRILRTYLRTYARCAPLTFPVAGT